MEEYRGAVRAPVLGCPGPLCRLWRSVDYGQEDKTRSQKATAERPTRPGDACDPPGPLLMGQRRPASSWAAARDAYTARRAVDKRQRNRTQLTVSTQVCVKILVSVESVPTELEQLSAEVGAAEIKF